MINAELNILVPWPASIVPFPPTTLSTLQSIQFHAEVGKLATGNPFPHPVNGYRTAWWLLPAYHGGARWKQSQEKATTRRAARNLLFINRIISLGMPQSRKYVGVALLQQRWFYCSNGVGSHRQSFLPWAAREQRELKVFCGGCFL